MASGSEILRELFISLGWVHDEASRKKVVGAEQKTTKELEAEQRKREVIDKKRRDAALATVKQFATITAAAEAMAIGVVAAVERIGKAFEAAYYSASRTGSSVKEMQAFGYAASQVGSSAEEAQSAVEGLAKAQREMPGYANMLKGLGASDPKNIVKSLTEIMPRLAAMPMAQAEAYSKALGIPEHLLLAMHDHLEEFKRFQAESNNKYSILGFDPEKAAEDGKNLSRMFRDLADTVAKITDAAGSKLFQDLKGPIADLNDYLLKNGQKIADIISKIAAAFVGMLKFLAENLPRLDSFVESMGGWKDVLAALALVVSVQFVGRMAGLLTALSGIAALSMPEWALALLGVTAATEIGRQAEQAHVGPLTPDEARKRSEGTKKFDESGWNPLNWFKPSWWKGSNSSGGGKAAPIGKLAQNSNAQAVIDELRKAGYNDNAIAAVVGSMQTESSFNPRAHNDIKGGHTGAWQWDAQRWPKVAAWIKSQGGDPFDYRWQAKAWIAEHNAKPGDAIYDSRDTATGGAILRSNPTLEQAVHGVRLSERFGAGEEGGRAANAANWLPHIRELAKRPAMVTPKNAGDADWQAHRGGRPPVPTIVSPFGGLNADKLRSQMNLGGGQPIGGGTPADHSRHVSVNSSPTITVHGVSDPTAAAGQIGARMDKHSSNLIRNMQSAIG